jgi:hypothetical protein
MEAILKPPLPGHGVVIENADIVPLKAGSEGKPGNDAEVIVADDLPHMPVIFEGDQMLPLQETHALGRLVVPQDNLQGGNTLVQNALHLFLKILRSHPRRENDGYFFIHSETTFTPDPSLSYYHMGVGISSLLPVDTDRITG